MNSLLIGVGAVGFTTAFFYLIVLMARYL